MGQSRRQFILGTLLRDSLTCLLAKTKCVCLFSSLSNVFFLATLHRVQLCGVYGLKWSYGQIVQSPLSIFAATSGKSLVSLLPLINALLAWSVRYSKFWIYFITQPWSVLLHNFVPDLFGELLGLHGVACLVVWQTLGPFKTGVCILRSWDRSCDT